MAGPSRFGASGIGAANIPGRVALGARANYGYGAGASSGDLGSQFSSAWSGFLGSAVNAGEVALGVGLLLLALGIVISQTSGGQAAGRVGAGAARRGLRAVPVVGALA